MRILFLILILAATSWGADFTVTVTIPDPIVADVLATVTAWRVRQFEDDGVTLKYPNNNALGKAIVEQALEQILRQQCEFDPLSCPPAIKTKLDNRTTASGELDTEIENAVVP